MQLTDNIKNQYTEFNNHFPTCNVAFQSCKSAKEYSVTRDGQNYAVRVAFKSYGKDKETDYAFQVSPSNQILEQSVRETIQSIGDFVLNENILGMEWHVHNV